MSLARQFASFVAVGTVGFAIDAGLFLALTERYLWGVMTARTTSVICAVAATWALNRASTFARHRSARPGAELLRYSLTQAGGLGVNVGVFALCLWVLSPMRHLALLALVLGSAAGLAVNFVCARTLVFRATP